MPNPYVQHKAMAERALFRLHAEAGLPVVTFRPPSVYGPRQPFYREPFFWDRLRDGQAFNIASSPAARTGSPAMAAAL